MPSELPDLWYSFVRAHRMMIREIERRLAAAGLPGYAWYDALWGLESGPDGTRRMHELADVLAIERYNLTRLIDRLEQEGLVTRSRSTTDGRAAFASITENGRVLRRKMWQVYESTVAELFLSQYGVAEQAALADGLNRTAAAVRANTAQARK
jgi:DNA-binding MarR family transcriptional regulator